MQETQAAAAAFSSTARPLRVTVLRGGPSAEREVSLVSGASVAAALRKRGHVVFEADIGPDNLAALDHAADVIFPVLHGTFGEDGTLQKIMEQRGLRFVGSGSAASALAMDKVAAKKRAAEIGIDTPEYEVVTPKTLKDFVARTAGLATPPVVIKPVDQGSSVLTAIVRQPEQLSPVLQTVLEEYGRALAERFIDGDELTVGVVGHQVLPPICIRPKREFYDYDAKYNADDTEYLFDAGHAPELLAHAQLLSRQVFERLGCRHLARIDWMVDRGGRLWFLEVNTLPGFTSHSLLPKAAARMGLPFDELADRLVRMAWKEPA